MSRRLIATALLVLALAVAFALSGCAQQEQPPAGGTVPEGSEQPTSPTSSSALAVGLHELEDGSVQAVGTLDYSDLEGGFWLITGAAPGSAESTTVAVIANGSDFQSELEALKGKPVMAQGKLLDGASIRMAGPEIEIESIEEVSDTVGPAD